MTVKRNDGRVCLAWNHFEIIEPGHIDHTRRCIYPNRDDAIDGMALYRPGGAVITLCAQYALYDKLCEEPATCLLCLGYH